MCIRDSHEILSKLGEQLTVIVHIDDFQWADQDSMLLLSNLFSRPDPPRMWFLVASRQEATLAALRIEGAVRTINLGPLSRDNATLLAREVLGTSLPAVDANRLDMLLEEARGHPYFI